MKPIRIEQLKDEVRVTLDHGDVVELYGDHGACTFRWSAT